METMENYLAVETSSGLMDLFISAPNSHQKHPVIIVYQEAFGVNHHIKNVCRRLSAQGYVAVAPELFHRDGRHLVIDYSDRQRIWPYLARITNENILSDTRDTIHFLTKLPNTDLSNLFTLGFCIGGFSSLLSATRFNLRGAISFYGSGVVRRRDGVGLTPFVEDFKHISCPVLLFYGALDASIPFDDRQIITRELSRNNVDFEMQVFEEGDHGFFCDERKSFNQESASSAWKTTLTWLEVHKSHTNPLTFISNPC